MLMSVLQFVWLLISVILQPQALIFVTTGLQLGKYPHLCGGSRHGTA
jgi:hypothetical protein